MFFKILLQVNMLTQSTTINIRISYVTWYAGTIASVIACGAVCISSTVTGIYTLFISASLSHWTIGVCQAFIRLAFYIRTAFVCFWALAPCSVSIYCTKRLYTTLFKRTWILTFSLDACLVVRAFIVAFAASC